MSTVETTTDAAPTGPRRIPRITPFIRVLVGFNVATIVASVIGYAANLNLLSFMFPQAAVFFPGAWALNSYYGTIGIWFFVMAIAFFVAGVAVLAAPAGHRGIGAFRAVTICGFVVACIVLAITGGLSLISFS